MKKKIILGLSVLSLIIIANIFQPLSEANSNNINQASIESQSEDVIEASSEGNQPFSLDQIEEYVGVPYVEVNANQPYFSNEERYNIECFSSYSDLDELGRCGVAYANICTELMPTEKRGEIGSVKPSGWHTANYHEHIDGNYLYNRCHLIGYQLSGENANEKNLITGTRYLNVDGMLPFENRVADYVKDTNNHVLYRVTPIFEGDNLVANGVLMEAYSVEDNGVGICFNVFCYNVQPGITIDYSNGESELSETSFTEENYENDSVTDSDVKEYVLNKNTKKFHVPECSSVKDIKSKNKIIVKENREELLEQGYEPCGVCKP